MAGSGVVSRVGVGWSTFIICMHGAGSGGVSGHWCGLRSFHAGVWCVSTTLPDGEARDGCEKVR